MTAVVPELVDPIEEPGPQLQEQKRPLLDPIWPMLLLTVWMPVAYFLGIAAIVWVVPAFVFGIPMIQRRTLRVPGSILPLVALVLWIPITALNLPNLNSAGVFTYRWLIWVSTRRGDALALQHVDAARPDQAHRGPARGAVDRPDLLRLPRAPVPLDRAAVAPAAASCPRACSTTSSSTT